MNIRCPLQKFYLWNGKIAIINQLFAENPNKYSYGPEGHTGIDFKTIGYWKYKRHFNNWKQTPRTIKQEEGRIPTVAAHDGTLSAILYNDRKGLGWGMKVTSDIMIEDGLETQYNTLYWHIETPWQSLKAFTGVWNLILRKTKVKKGSIIAICGNNGKSTGPHLHFELRRRRKINGAWTEWVKLDPIQYFDDNEVVYQRTGGIGKQNKSFYQGKEITEEQKNTILNSLPKVI